MTAAGISTKPGDFFKDVKFTGGHEQTIVAVNNGDVDGGVTWADGQGAWEDGYNSGGYEWCINKWGTKWGAYDVSMYMNPRRGMCLSFQSAWSPPLPVIRKLFALFPTMQFEFEYFECGSGFCGGLYYNPEALEYGGDAESEWYSNTYCGPRGG